MSSRFLRYDEIKQLAAELGRPASTLIALAPANDPFAITPTRRDGAKWFARIWKRFNFRPGTHLRRVHYKLISQDKPLTLPDGTAYENTEEAWKALGRTSNDARYLDLIPAEDFIDRRNAKPLIHLPDGSRSGSIWLADATPDTDFASKMPDLPELHLDRPTNLQQYHVEIWCEKTTINNILQSEAGYIDARPLTASSAKSTCNARPDHTFGSLADKPS
jgi:hypothetical protein